MWTATGPITKTIRPWSRLISRIIAAILAMLTSTRRSDEISLVMNAKPWRSRSRNSGTMRMPSLPHTIGSPVRTSRSLRQEAWPSRMMITASMRWLATSIQRPPWRTTVRWLVVE